MISALVLLLTAMMAGSFLLVYLLNPGWRARIEQPKHCFQDQLKQYDNRTKETHEESP